MYLLHGKLKAKAGHADELASILLEASRLIATAEGCKLYAIGRDPDDPDAVWVTELWNNREDHGNSLNIRGVRKLIRTAMPILDGRSDGGQELEIIGGFLFA